MRRFVALAPLALLFGMCALACTTAPAQLGPEPNVAYDATRGQELTSRACGFQFFSVIPIMTGSREQRAYLRLKEQAPFDYLTDIQVVVYWRYAGLGNLYCTMLKAKAYPKS